jgi:SPP1 family predicted phage head-tail adaptor
MHAGRLNTPIRIQQQMITGSGINKAISWVDMDNTSPTDAASYIFACWEGLYGSEAWVADSVQAERPAKVTIRYRADVNEKCRVLRDGVEYRIVSANSDKRQWLEMRVKGAVNG